MMKLLDRFILEESVNILIKHLEHLITEIEEIERTIEGLINLKDSFTGNGAEAIKLYYLTCHQPFILKLKQVISMYSTKLSHCGKSFQAFEPSMNGFVRTDFLQGELTNALNKTNQVTNDLIKNANQVISSVSDIIFLPQFDGESFEEEVIYANKQITKTINDLEEVDGLNVQSFNELKAALELLSTYISEINLNTTFNSRLENFNSLQLLSIPSHSRLHSSLNSSFNTLKVTTNSYQKFADKKVYTDFLMSSWFELKLYPSTYEDQKKNYIVGQKVTNGDVTLETSAGKLENKWSEPNQFGGSSSFSGIHVSAKHDTSIIDTSFTQDIGSAEVEASAGGKSFFPLLKAGGAVYSSKVRTQLDKEIPLFGSTGLEAKGEVLKANAYAGVDNSSVGISAKTAVAEGEVSGILPLPFTDYNLKGTTGVSAFGLGGEAKIGKEIVLDLRLLIGVKIGLSLEKEE
ncbi:T7SS effector LXG polymorphic toxin [Fictibacillus iocasae]|uniref:T7SS effector LXG polymorphic toxin n=1 Tax=Fictibacillus iocasae TaxID=2715437 RepID=A0ABW2NTK7_9BACL